MQYCSSKLVILCLQPGLKLRVCNKNVIFLFLNQNICCGYSKEPSQWDGSFEHPKHMFKLMGKKIMAILRKLCLLNWPYGVTENHFSYFSTKTYVVGTQKNRLDETVLLSTQNTCLN